MGMERIGFLASSPTDRGGETNMAVRSRWPCDLSTKEQERRPESVTELTGSGNAVEAHEGVEAGGCTRENTRQAKGSKTAHAEFLFSSVRDQFQLI